MMMMMMMMIIIIIIIITLKILVNTNYANNMKKLWTS